MNNEQLEAEIKDLIVYSFSCSSGPGGQNVNKVNTKVELRFNLISTTLFSEVERELIFRELKNKINNEGEIVLVSQSERTQLLNKMVVTDKFYDLVSESLTIPQKRRATRPTFASKVKRLEEKRSRGVVKKLRRKSGESSD